MNWMNFWSQCLHDNFQQEEEVAVEDSYFECLHWNKKVWVFGLIEVEAHNLEEVEEVDFEVSYSNNRRRIEAEQNSYCYMKQNGCLHFQRGY